MKYLSAAIVPMFVWFTARTTLQTKKQDSTSDITNQYLKDLKERVEKLEADNARLRKIETKYNTLVSKYDHIKAENESLNRRLESMEDLVESTRRTQAKPIKSSNGGKKNVTDKPY